MCNTAMFQAVGTCETERVRKLSISTVLPEARELHLKLSNTRVYLLTNSMSLTQDQCFLIWACESMVAEEVLDAFERRYTRLIIPQTCFTHPYTHTAQDEPLKKEQKSHVHKVK